MPPLPWPTTHPPDKGGVTMKPFGSGDSPTKKLAALESRATKGPARYTGSGDPYRFAKGVINNHLVQVFTLEIGTYKNGASTWYEIDGNRHHDPYTKRKDVLKDLQD